jgi:hypothetical protein
MSARDDEQVLLAAFSDLYDWLASQGEHALANVAMGCTRAGADHSEATALVFAIPGVPDRSRRRPGGDG